MSSFLNYVSVILYFVIVFSSVIIISCKINNISTVNLNKPVSDVK